MINKIRKYFRIKWFQPGFVGLFTNPFYFARKGLYENILSLAPFITGKTLDVGCGKKPYQALFGCSEYIGLEIDTQENRKNKAADYYYNGIIFPFRDNEFDSILISQVFEHVFHPNEFLKEVNRVLKQHGVILMTVPFVWDEHEQPYDYARYSSFGIKSVLEKNGFEIVNQKKSINDLRVIFQLLNEYIYKKTTTNNRYFDALITLILIAPCNMLGEILSKFFPKNDDLYLDNIVLARKK
jgi:SAM-dependent methyltransferase